MNTTDFLKSCTTNVRVVEDILPSKYAIHQRKDGALVHTAGFYPLAYLRGRNILCAAVEDQVWVFGSSELESRQLLDTTQYGISESDSFGAGSDASKRG